MLGLWMKVAVDTTLLSLEAQNVIGTRLLQIALGRAPQLMVTEKMLAFIVATATVATGGSVHTVVDGYHRHVQANASRLKLV